MKKLMFSLAAMALLALTIQSCDMIEAFEKNKEGVCDFVYPITLVMPDDATVAVNDEEELETAFEDWEDNNPNSDEKPTFQYPLEMVNIDGETITVNNDDELEEAFEECKDYEGHCGKDKDDDCDDKWYEKDDCFDLIFPVTVIFPDSTTSTVNDEDALETAIEGWYDANPNATAKPTFSFPIQIKYEDGTIETINSEMELEEAYDDCD